MGLHIVLVNVCVVARVKLGRYVRSECTICSNEMIGVYS